VCTCRGRGGTRRNSQRSSNVCAQAPLFKLQRLGIILARTLTFKKQGSSVVDHLSLLGGLRVRFADSIVRVRVSQCSIQQGADACNAAHLSHSVSPSVYRRVPRKCPPLRRTACQMAPQRGPWSHSSTRACRLHIVPARAGVITPRQPKENYIPTLTVAKAHPSASLFDFGLQQLDLVCNRGLVHGARVIAEG